MEEHGRRDNIPIVVPSTGALLGVLAAACGARRVVEVGTAIGVSTLYIARAMAPDGLIVSFEIDPERQRAARAYLDRAGVGERADLRLLDAGEGLAELDSRPGTWCSWTASRATTRLTWSWPCRCCEAVGWWLSITPS